MMRVLILFLLLTLPASAGWKKAWVISIGASMAAVASSVLTLEITNAGNAKEGVVIL